MMGSGLQSTLIPKLKKRLTDAAFERNALSERLSIRLVPKGFLKILGKIGETAEESSVSRSVRDLLPNLLFREAEWVKVGWTHDTAWNLTALPSRNKGLDQWDEAVNPHLLKGAL